MKLLLLLLLFDYMAVLGEQNKFGHQLTKQYNYLSIKIDLVWLTI